ncbi:hypothetical protein M0P65_02900 [Candidatus Gracilibacteria bacterium]|nr:hypothetical protein [Candidatus Gracilibacteria bacterium]
MIYKIEGEIYGNKNLLVNNQETMLFDGFYISKDEGTNGFPGLLKNYLKYKFSFYFNFNGNNLNYIGNNERSLRFLAQDNIEIELSIFGLTRNISVVSWILSGVNEYENNDKIFHNLGYLVNDNFCWNYYKKAHEEILNNPNNFNGYKFRLSNLEVTPGTSLISKYQEIIKNKQILLKLDNEELLTQINYYNNGLFLENHGFMSDAFNYFYKIIEIEENKFEKVILIKKSDLIKKISDLMSEINEEINLETFRQEIIDEQKKERGNEIRTEIFNKYNLSGKIEDFNILRKIRGKFSHQSGMKYIYSENYEIGKEFALEIILKKISI